MEKRSLIAFETWSNAASSFDQVVWASLMALIAYLGGSFEPRPWEFSVTSHNAEVASLLFLLAAMWFAFRRMEENVLALRMNHNLLHWGEARAELVPGILGSRAFGYNADTGEPFTHDDAVKSYNDLSAKMDALSPLLDSKDVASTRLYKLRNRAFALGLGFLVLSRLLPAA
jgi:hypothetical protein